jgi:hypothetical protein
MFRAVSISLLHHRAITMTARGYGSLRSQGRRWVEDRHCERSEAIHSQSIVRMDCFVASLLAMTANTTPHSRGAMRPGCARILRPRKTEGVGNAGCATHPQPRVRNKTKHTSVVTARFAGSPGIPARNGFNGLYRALPGERIRLVTVISGLRVCQTRSGRLASANLTPATGARTTRLCRPRKASFVCVPFVSSRALSTRPAIP